MAHNFIDMDVEEVPEIGGVVDIEIGDSNGDSDMTGESDDGNSDIGDSYDDDIMTGESDNTNSDLSDNDDTNTRNLFDSKADKSSHSNQMSLKKKIKSLLKKSKGGGSVATSKLESDLPTMPDLYIKGYGIVPLPVNEAVAQSLYPFFETAPYGMGEETVVDESVRRSWQMDPEKLEIRNKEFLSVIKGKVAKDVKEELGCRDSAVRVEIYKLLLYEPGGHFKPHRDTEKAEGMFGTLIVQLPSLFTGGDLILSHNGKKEVIKFSHQQSTSTCIYAAHYADVEHEVTEITTGYRLALIYSLCWDGNGMAQDVKKHTEQTRKLTGLLQKLSVISGQGLRVAWAMEHMYSLESLKSKGIKALKGKDKLIAQNLQNALKEMMYKDRFSMYIAKYTKYEEKQGDCTQEGYSGYWGNYMGCDNECDEGCFETEDAEVIDSGTELEDFITTNGHVIKISLFVISPLEDILNGGDIEDEKWWGEEVRKECSGPTGNAGATQTYWYHKYLLVLWKEEDMLDVLKNDPNSAIEYLKELLDDAMKEFSSVHKSNELLADKTHEHRMRLIQDKSIQLLQIFSAEKGSFFSSNCTGDLADFLEKLDDINLVKNFLHLIKSKEAKDCLYTKELLDKQVTHYLHSSIEKYSWPLLKTEMTELLLAQLPKHTEKFLKLCPDGVPKGDIIAQLAKMYTQSQKKILDSDLEALTLLMFQYPDTCTEYMNDLLKVKSLDRLTVLSRVMLHLFSNVETKSLEGSTYFNELENKFIHVAQQSASHKQLNSTENVNALSAIYLHFLKMKSNAYLLSLNNAIITQKPNDNLLCYLLGKFNESIPSVVYPLLKKRLKQLKSVKKAGVPKLSWKQPSAVIENHPEVQRFLRSSRETYKYVNFNDLNHARNWVAKHFKSHWGGDKGFSAKAHADGRGKNAFAIIEKTKDIYEKQVKEYQDRMVEFKHLKSLKKQVNQE